MRAWFVEVGPKIGQFFSEVCRRPKKHVTKVSPPQGADQPFHEWMGQGNVGYGLDFRQVQYTQIGLPLVEPIKRIVVGAKVLRQPELPSNGAVEHPAERYTIAGARMNAEPNDPALVLIHELQ